MRRNLLLPLAAVLVLIPSAVFFFQSAEYVKDAEDVGSDVVPASDVPRARGELHAKESVQPAKGVPLSKIPSQLLEEAFAAMSSMDEKARDAALETLVSQLRVAGPAGLEAIRHFLVSGRDVRFRNGFSFSDGRLSKAPTLRLALIDALRDWSGSAGALLEVLNSKATIFETTLAVRGLEKQFPGTYRSEAIESLKRRVDDPNAWNSAPSGEDHVFDVARHFQGAELLPQIHALVVKEPLFRASQYVRMLSGFSAEARGAALDRLLAEPKFTQMFFANPHVTNHFSYVDERMRAFTVHAFTQVWSAPQKLQALENIGGVPPDHLSDFFVKPGETVWSRSQLESDLKEARARKVLLAELEPAADTPELQEALKKARAAVTREIAKQVDDRRYENDPQQEVEFASGVGKATIKGRRIENIEIRSAPIIPKVDDAGSTAEPGR